MIWDSLRLPEGASERIELIPIIHLFYLQLIVGSKAPEISAVRQLAAGNRYQGF